MASKSLAGFTFNARASATLFSSPIFRSPRPTVAARLRGSGLEGLCPNFLSI